MDFSTSTRTLKQVMILKESKYPKLVVHKEDGAIFLMKEPNIGIVLYFPEGGELRFSYELGDVAGILDPANLEEFDGTLEISNER